MSRPITEEDLQSYVDQALDPVRRAEVNEYLDRHPDIAQRVEGYSHQRDALREAFAPVAQEPIPPRLHLARLMEARRRSYAGSWRLAAVSVFLLALGGAAGWSLHDAVVPGSAGVASLAREAAESYAVYEPDPVRPVEIRADGREELLGWVSQRLQHRIAVPDLAKAGYRFMGGRLVATSHGPAGLFMYDDDHGTRLVMLVRPMVLEQDSPMSQHTVGEVNGFAWADKGMGYSLVGRTSAGVLHPLADQIRRQI
ncbi:anti-sigma factor [Pendulispora brunnea]|uniref:Anti-sigma factor n=1 Tax=Pendulispora brunnea TaxID=2905690 RepID=A0ABZ2K6X6_9BACT